MCKAKLDFFNIYFKKFEEIIYNSLIDSFDRFLF